ncbi:MAG TPA: UvrB/UvrC motif-containing protein [Acidobacteriaceae bacterium]|nr:UvrB/UvrC motif-containing protein [Acidobacteriaceae bacterium]
MLDTSLPIPANDLEAWLHDLPARPSVFALFGPEAADGNPALEPYISKTANLRRRMRRLLAPSFAGGKRLHLGGTAVRLDYSEVGSDFATALLMLQATRRYCGERVRKHLHLRSPSLLRLAWENRYPRVYVTNRVIQRALATTYGPFQSRAAAERYLDDSLNFFELRRCTEELHPDPAFPGCVYSEMKMCLAPCFKGCSDERYAAEVEQVREYFASRGAWTLARLEKERDAASAALDFEKAARLHLQIQKMKTVAQQAAPLVHSLADLDAVIVQPAVAQVFAAPGGGPEKMSNRALRTEATHVAIYLVRGGRIFGPGFYSVEGMRHPNERAGSTSLFAHPTLLEPTPLEAPPVTPGADSGAIMKVARGQLEQRLQTVLEGLESQARLEKMSPEHLSEHLSLLARWYYRAAHRRVGEIFFRDEPTAVDSAEERPFPLSRILRGISRVYCGQKDGSEIAADAGLA